MPIMHPSQTSSKGFPHVDNAFVRAEPTKICIHHTLYSIPMYSAAFKGWGFYRVSQRGGLNLYDVTPIPDTQTAIKRWLKGLGNKSLVDALQQAARPKNLYIANPYRIVFGVTTRTLGVLFIWCRQNPTPLCPTEAPAPK